MHSLRRRLLLGTAIGTAAILSGAGLALYLTMKASLLGEFDTALEAKAETLAGLIEQEGERIELEFAEADMAEFARGDRPEYYQVWREDGTVVARSPALEGADLVGIVPSLEGTMLRAADLPDGRRGRIAILRCSARPERETEIRRPAQRLVVALARDTQDVEAALAQLRLVLLIVGVLATAASVGILAWLIRIGLQPVERLARQIERIDEQCLSLRVAPERSARELAPVVDRLNDLLDRLEAAFVREKTLTADVAHELRTPLAGLRSTLEVTLSRERETGEYCATLSECLTICAQTQAMVENLLALARLDAGNETFDRRQVDVRQLIQDSWKPFEKAGADRSLNVRWQMESPLTIESDACKLRSVLTNVFENTVHYADVGGDVVISGTERNGDVQVSISNTGSHLSDGQVARVFERFWRGEAAREKDGTHCGLGLSLCKKIVEFLGGAISARSPAEGEFALTITLPSRSETQSSSGETESVSA